MTLPITSDTLAAAYDYLCTTPQFNKWNLPASEDVRFVVRRGSSMCAYYELEGDQHIIAVFAGKIGRSDSLIETMAHEMIHLHQGHSGMLGRGEHGAAFRVLARRVCAVHGWDEKLF